MADSKSPASKRTITVVDDNPELVEIVRVMLEEKGFNVRCAYSGQELFAGLEEQKPDLILLDIMMPQMDGLEVLTLLKENPGTASIPVILLTAKMQYEDILGGYKTGADYFITKPFKKTDLMAGINLILNGDQVSRDNV
jgi:CheY-like chemotaxis protein